jgi:hypothetical protein
MKKHLLIMTLSLFTLQAGTNAQQQKQNNKPKDPVTTEWLVNSPISANCLFVQGQLLLTNLREEEFDHITILNMHGEVVQKQTVSGPALRLDLSSIEEGVHLLLLRSSTRLKERNIKLVVRR